jgi:acyl-CoA carboxylase subunit beta
VDLLKEGIVDSSVAEHPDAADEPEAFIARMSQTLARELGVLLRAHPGDRLAARLARYRQLG